MPILGVVASSTSGSKAGLVVDYLVVAGGGGGGGNRGECYRDWETGLS